MAVDLFNPHDGLTGRDGGPYLDEVERRNAETIRAAKEDRKPDYDKAPATAGTPLVTGAVLAQIANPASNPSMEAQVAAPATEGVDKLVRNKDSLLTKFASRPETDAEKDAKKGEADNPANPVKVGTDPDIPAAPGK